MVWPSEYVDGPRPFNRCVTPPTRGDWVGGLSKVGGSVGLGPQLGMGQPNPAGGQLGRKCLRGFCLILGDFGWVVGITPRGGCGWVVGFFKKKSGPMGGFWPGEKYPPPTTHCICWRGCSHFLFGTTLWQFTCHTPSRPHVIKLIGDCVTAYFPAEAAGEAVEAAKAVILPQGVPSMPLLKVHHPP